MRYIAGMGHPGRISPTMNSRKLQALDFIKRYFAEWGHSPSLDEIGAHLGVSKQRASELVHQLCVDKSIEITAGRRRGIRLVDRGEEISEADLLVRLRERGWRIVAGTRSGGVVALPTLTETGLTGLPRLDHE